MFSNLEYWETKFKYKIQWNFFATSHGKGVVDSIGDSGKDQFFKKKKLTGKVIHTAEEVAKVAQGCHANFLIKYIYHQVKLQRMRKC